MEALPLSSMEKMVDLSLPHRRKKWSRSSVYKRKSLSSDWFAFRKNMRKSRNCKKKKKMTDSSKYGLRKEGIATWKARKPNCMNTRSTGLSISVKPIWCCKRVNARWPLTRPKDELVAPTSNKNSWPGGVRRSERPKRCFWCNHYHKM